MVKLKENIRCYAHPLQREILVGLSENETIENTYFLTGGTALSVFYLHHRTSIKVTGKERIRIKMIGAGCTNLTQKQCESRHLKDL